MSPIHAVGVGARGHSRTAQANGRPSQRIRPCQRHRNSTPRNEIGNTASGALAIVRTAPGSPAVQWPMASIRSTPLPATHRKGPPRPTGSSRAPRASAGIMTKSAIGEVVRLASRPYMAARLKCWTANGPVAAPATRLAVTATVSQCRTDWNAAIGQGTDSSRVRGGHASDRATSAAVAANDIWNPGVTIASGCRISTTIAATASACMVIAGRSSRIAANATEAVTAARCAGAGAPDRTR